MIRFTTLTMWVAIVANLCLFGFVVQMGGILQLPLTILLPIYPLLGLIALVKAYKAWPYQKWKSLLPLAVLMIGLVAVIPSVLLGRTVSTAIFFHHLPKYQAVVERVESGEIAISDKTVPLDIPRSQRPRCYAVFAYREPDGETAVVFLIGRVFPLQSSGYMYYSGSTVEKGSTIRRRWPQGMKITNHWYQIGG